jgi:hypothetical protein
MTPPTAVMPFNDPTGSMYTHLQAVQPLLRQAFSQVFLSIPEETASLHPAHVQALQQDPFFNLLRLPKTVPVGAHFAALYRHAAAESPPEQVLHLCYPDRLAFALQTRHRQQWLDDIAAVTPQRTPLIFHRSAYAWGTHPQNYVKIEQFATTLGELALGVSLDFAWCHMAVQAGWLRQVMPQVRNADISMVAEMVLQDVHAFRTQEVDWLEWEDAFYSPLPEGELKRQREASLAETQKRLNYVLPMLELIQQRAEQDVE